MPNLLQMSDNVRAWQYWVDSQNRLVTSTNGGTGTVNYIWTTWQSNVTSDIHYVRVPVSDTDHMWTGWNQSYTTSFSTTNTTWSDWFRTGRVALNREPVVQHRDIRPQETEAQRAAREEHWARVRAEQDAQRIAREAARTAAQERATELLGMVLSKSQMEEYRTRRSFRVRGSHGRRYRVHHGTSGNVRQIIETPEGHEQEVAALCAHPQMYDPGIAPGQGGYLPTEDCLAAQALALMTDEEKFIATANLHRGRLLPA